MVQTHGLSSILSLAAACSIPLPNRMRAVGLFLNLGQPEHCGQVIRKTYCKRKMHIYSVWPIGRYGRN